MPIAGAAFAGISALVDELRGAGAGTGTRPFAGAVGGSITPGIRDRDNHIPPVVSLYYDSEVGFDFKRPFGNFDDD